MVTSPAAMHAFLLGDSVFDNAAYTRGEPDVAAHLRAVLGRAWRVTLLAVDGSTTADLGPQLDRLPVAATAVLSLGGNDALMSADLLDAPVRSTGEALDRFGERVDAFETSYGYVLEALTDRVARLVVCTIYNGDLGPREAPRARIALMMFNDAIIRSALRAGADVLELRAVCSEPQDFANPIEPSGAGGAKIARAIGEALTGDQPRSRLFG